MIAVCYTLTVIFKEEIYSTPFAIARVMIKGFSRWALFCGPAFTFAGFCVPNMRDFRQTFGLFIPAKQ